MAIRFFLGRRRRKREGEGGRATAESSFRPELEVIRLHDRSPLFAFGVPPGWRDLEEHELKSAGPDAITGVITDRADDVTTAITVCGPYDRLFPELSGRRGPTLMMAHTQELAQARAQAPRQGAIGPALLGAVQKEILAGDPAVIIHLRQWAEFRNHVQGWSADTEVWTLHRGHLYYIEMTGPEFDADTYRAAFNTVLGTWQWQST